MIKCSRDKKDELIIRFKIIDDLLQSIKLIFEKAFIHRNFNW